MKIPHKFKLKKAKREIIKVQKESQLKVLEYKKKYGDNMPLFYEHEIDKFQKRIWDAQNYYHFLAEQYN